MNQLEQDLQKREDNLNSQEKEIEEMERLT